MVKVHFNQDIQTVETYDSGDYDRTSVPIAELNEDEFNEMECYRFEMKKQTIEEYQKRWRKSRNSDCGSSSDCINNRNDTDNLSPPLKSCLINKSSNNLNNKLNATAINAAITVAMSSSIEDDTSLFGEGQAQPNIALNISRTSNYNLDGDRIHKISVENDSNLVSTNENYPKECLNLFAEPENENIDLKKIKTNEDHNRISVISPNSFESNDSQKSDNDVDPKESDENNSFIRLFEDSFEKGTGEGDSDYIKDMSLAEGENSITLPQNVLSEDIPTTSFYSSEPRLFTDSLFTSSPILSESILNDKKLKSSQLQEETPEESQEDSQDEEEFQEDILKVLEMEGEEEKEEKEKILRTENVNVLEQEQEPELEEDSDDEIDKHPHSDSYINYGGTQHINIKPRRNNIYDDYTGISSCPFGKPISFLDDLPEVIHTSSKLSTSLPSLSSSSSLKKESPKSSNFFGSPFSPPSKSPYRSSSSSSVQQHRLNRYGSFSNYSTGIGNSNNNDGGYLVSKRNYLTRDSKQKSYTSSGYRLSQYTTSKWEGIGSRNSNKSNNNNNNNNNSSKGTSPSNKYYPRPATKLASTSSFSSSWIYDASF
jgi:hypothetical protein